jgi:L-histidine N-alpha-methyltransferase
MTTISNTTNSTQDKQDANITFLNDVIAGLSCTPKHLESKYFYDAVGDKLFQDIMNSPEYYPTNCEMEIFSNQTEDLAALLSSAGDEFDLIELGVGDASKSSHLLKHLLKQKTPFNYLPIDISGHIIEYLKTALPVSIPGIKINGLQGDYFDMLKKASTSNNRKVVLFLGSNIGNMSLEDAESFCQNLRSHLQPGDMALIGFDLKKNPKTILAAYNDSKGVTKQFNLNLLSRINSDLKANFDIANFDHFPTYDPETGACKSYIISLAKQTVTINNQTFAFEQDEHIYTEVSQKFTTAQTTELAQKTGFKTIHNFYDSKNWFLDTVWVAE